MFSHLRHPVLRLIAGCCFSAWLAISADGQTNTPAQIASVTSDQLLPGVVVEKVEKKSAAAEAGVREGDVLLRWSRGEAHGAIETPLDLLWVQIEESSRGNIRLEGARAGTPISWDIRTDYWDVKSRLNFSPGLFPRYLEANKLLREGKTTEAYEHWQSIASFLPKSSSARTSLLLDAASSLGVSSNRQQSDQAYQEALGSSTGKPALDPLIYLSWAVSAWHRKDHARALQVCDEGVESAVQSDLTVAWLQLLCMSIAVDKGDIDGAEKHAASSRKIWERLAPNSTGSLANLISLGSIAASRGNLALSERYYREVLNRWTKSQMVFMLADAYWGLGWLARLRGDYTSAERNYRKGLAIYQQNGSPPQGTAQLLSNLAFLAEERGDFSAAQKYIDKAMKFNAGTRVHVSLISQLGNLRKRQGDLGSARKYLEQAKEIRSKVEPGSLALSSTLADLGDVARDTGDLAAADQYYRDALAIRQKNAPGSAEHAVSLASVAGIIRHERPDDASGLYDAALTALENQTSRLGGNNDDRSGFRAQHAGIYRDYIDLLLSLHKQDTAFAVVERFRARSLLEMLSTAHVDVHGGAEQALIERESSLEANIHAKSDRRIRMMGEAHEEKQQQKVDEEIADLLAQYQDVEEQIRSTSPAYAALTQPQPLTAKEVQSQLLDPDTLLLEYSLGEERSYVFAVTPDSLNAFELPKRSDVEKTARRVYSLLTARNRAVKGETPAQKQARMAQAEAEYPRAASELGRMLLGPVAAQLQNKRLLIVTDGALAYIPFSVLPEPRNPNVNITDTAAPLMVNHEIVNLPSASVLAVLRQQELGRRPAPKAVAVLADPVFDRHDPRLAFNRVSSASKASLQTRSAHSLSSSPAIDPLLDAPSSIGLLTRSASDVGLSRNGELHLPRLRFSRREAEEIMAVTPQGAGKKAVDFDASRATAISPELSQYRIVHFATHGLLDSVHPELSGLVFSMVDEKGRPQNGFLELQDIYNLNLPADLVVLSACETGLGKEISGEGLVGLTRGFMYAGASRVMASLWKVSDAGTAALMGTFYAAMETDGLPPAAALRAAQIKMWQQKRWSHPYYWAAFQIQGEWK